MKSTDVRFWLLGALAIALVLALRNPELLLAPRFWGEEGELFYQPAYTGSLWFALTDCPQDYYNLGCRLGTLLALAVPVEHAPLTTTGFALVVQMLPALLVLRLLRRGAFGPWTAGVGVAAVLLGSPLHETWLNSTGSSHYFLLTGALTLLYYELLGLRWLAWGLLLATGLSSTYPVGLVPIALWLAVRQPSRGRTVATACLGLGLAVQMAIYFAGGSGVLRTQQLEPAIAVAAFFVKTWVLPVGGLDLAERIGLELKWAIFEDRFWRWLPLLLVPMAATWAAILGTRSVAARRLFVCGHLLAITALFGSLGHKHELIGGLGGGRYFVSVSALHMLGALEALRTRAPVWLRALPALFLAATLLQGVLQYCDRPATFHRGPDWRAEVAQWRRDPTHPMATWPESRWHIRLPPP